MSKRDLSGMINDASSELEPVRKRGRGLAGMFSDTASAEQPEPDVEIIQGDETTLSEREAEELATCERIIERGLRTFLEVGSALLKIRDLHLYRNEYATFEDYYRERWSLERSQVYRLMDAAEVTRNLQSSPMGEVPLPANERQARPLTKLKDPQEQREAWERAVTTAAGRVTAAHVEQVVKEMLRDLDNTPAATTEKEPQIIDQEPSTTDPVPPPPTPLPDEVTVLRQRIARIEQRHAEALEIIEEYQEHITRAQQYKPTSERGEAVSPLLRALERVTLLLREGTPDA